MPLLVLRERLLYHYHPDLPIQIALPSVSDKDKQKGGGIDKGRIIVDENNHIIAPNPPSGWTTAPERLNESIWSIELESYMSEIFSLTNIRVIMASTEESKRYTLVIQCGDRIFHWDEYFE